MTTLRTRRTLGAAGLGVAGLASVLALAGCASSAADADSSGSGAGSSSSGSGSTSSSGSASSGSYKDGTYSAEGSYVSPGGAETIKVEVTIADDKVTAVTVTPEATDNQALQYQKQFASGISSQVVGKRIGELSGVSKVSGSSLTSGGFAKAIADIESQAAE